MVEFIHERCVFIQGHFSKLCTNKVVQIIGRFKTDLLASVLEACDEMGHGDCCRHLGWLVLLNPRVQSTENSQLIMAIG